MGIYPTIHHVVVIFILVTYTVHELQLETGMVRFKKCTAVINQKMLSKGFMFTVDDIIIIIIIIVIFINSNWVVTRWQWLFYMYTKYEIGY